MDAAPSIVVEHRKELSYLLCQAAEIEHLAMCQYLYAAFSLKTRPGPGLAAEQLEVVERWRQQILAIAAEEMLHWALVNNLLTAIGSAPFLSRPNLPHRAKGYPPSVQFALLPFGADALQHFVYFERPEGADVAEVAEFAPTGPRPAPMDSGELQPRTQDFVSQGELYRALDDGLEHLAAKLGEDALFIGPRRAQAGPAAFGWPGLIPVTDLASAKTALVRIIEQGEGGNSRDVEKAHFGRFLRILDEYEAIRATDPSFDPAHPVAAAVVRTVEGEPPSGPFITDPTTAAVSDLFNVINDLVLQILTRYFAFGQETDEQLRVLTDAGVGLMFGAIKPLGLLAAELPVGDDAPGATAGANFQLAYKANFLLPHRRVAWIRFAERLEEAAAFADAIDDPRATTVLAPVAQMLRRTATSLSDHLDVTSDPEEAMTGAAATADPAASAPRISVSARGPYRVHGRVPLRRMRDVRSEQDEPESWQVTERFPDADSVALCRCGQSSTKPFCDGSHTTAEWDPTEAAPTTTYDERAKLYPAPGIVMRDDRDVCAHVGFCTNRMTTVWQTVRELAPTDTVARAYVMAMIERCPSGALSYRLTELDDDVEPEYGAAVNVTEDGPLFVTGRIPVERSDGQPLEARNRVVLCRCGASAIKPLCDGSHLQAGFRDSGPDRGVARPMPVGPTPATPSDVQDISREGVT